MNNKKILIVAGCAILAALSFGQGGPPQGGPPGGGPVGFGRGMMGGGFMSPEMLLRRTDVQEDLALTEDQKTQILTLMESARPQGGPGGPGEGPGGGGPGGPPPDGQGGGPGGPPPGGGQGGPPPGGPGGGNSDQFRKQMDANRKKVSDGIKKILTADQQARLKEISVQLSGNAAAVNPDIQKDLALTDAQKTKIKSLTDLQGKANRSAFEKMRNGDIERDELMATIKKNTKALGEEIGKVLTDDQKAKLKTMGGKTFTPSESDNQG